jgi:hypothetical protein
MGARSRGSRLMTDMMKAPAPASAKGLRKSDPATSEITSKHNVTNGAVQAEPQNGAEPFYIPKHTKRKRRTKAVMTDVRTAIKDLLEASHPQTVRQVFYALSVRGIVAKSETEYKMTVGRLLVEMREKGEIPFDWIVDHTRATYCPASFISVPQSLRWLTKRYRRSLWDDANVLVYVFCEKDALAAVVEQETAPYCVPLVVCRGYSSITKLHETAQEILAANRKTFIYHLGDHDPSGQDAARDTEEKLRRYAPGIEIHFERVAVTLEQIESWDLPSRPTKTQDPRAKKFGRSTSVELDAIPADKLRALVRSRIKLHVDKKRMKALRATEKKDRKFLSRVAALHAEAQS